MDQAKVHQMPQNGGHHEEGFVLPIFCPLSLSLCIFSLSSYLYLHSGAASKYVSKKLKETRKKTKHKQSSSSSLASDKTSTNFMASVFEKPSITTSSSKKKGDKVTRVLNVSAPNEFSNNLGNNGISVEDAAKEKEKERERERDLREMRDREKEERREREKEKERGRERERELRDLLREEEKRREREKRELAYREKEKEKEYRDDSKILSRVSSSRDGLFNCMLSLFLLPQLMFLPFSWRY